MAPVNNDDFRRHAHDIVDWIADYFEELPKQSVLPDVAPGDIRKSLPVTAPEQGEPFASIMSDFERIIMPGITGWQHPGWFAYFPANSSPPSVLAEMITAALGQQGMMWITSPAATELEMVTLDWLVDLLGLPPEWKMAGPGGGSIQVSASDASHLALVIARQRQSAPTDQLVAYASAQAHSSLEKGARVAGYRHFRSVAVGSDWAMSPSALADAVGEDCGRGLVPAFVCSTVGTTGTTAIDPIPAISEVARAEGIWHHVDAAFAGNAMICPEFRRYQPGLDEVDSYVFNPHKWLLTNFDCSVFYVADRKPLLEALQITPPYLRNAQSSSGEVVDYRDWQVPLGRRFRALKLWWVIRSYGAEGLREMIRSHIALAQDLVARIQASPQLEVVATTPFSLVSFRHVDGDEATDAIAARINHSGHSYVTPSVIDGHRFIRVSIGGANTTAADVDRLWEVVSASN